MSRLIVKNLPKGVSEAKLKELFSEKGVVTDVQLKYTKEGKFRHFGFIGLKTEEQAEAAIEYFNNSFIDTSRITVSLCAELGDTSKPKSWSKYAPDSNAYKKVQAQADRIPETTTKTKNNVQGRNNSEKQMKQEKSNTITEVLEKHKDDALFTEFLETHAIAGTNAIWSNDTTTDRIPKGNNSNEADEKETREEDEAVLRNESEKIENEEERVADMKISDLEYMQILKTKTQSSNSMEKGSEIKIKENNHGPLKLLTVKVRGLGYNHKKKHIKQFFHPLVPKSIRVPPKIKGIAYVGFKTEKQLKQALNKNKSFLDGKRLLVSSYEAKEVAEKSNVASNKLGNARWKEQEEALQSEESIAESGRMFVRNLAYTTTEADIQALFEKFGPLSEVNLPIDKTTRKPKGFGVVMFMMPEHAVKAYVELDGTVLNGRMLHILPGKGKVTSDQLLENDSLDFKKKKEAQKKATAGCSLNWNTLFLGQNAVVEAIAATYNTTKEKVLDDSGKGSSVAVRLALGETQLVEDTKKFLEDNGVHLDAFNQLPENRSKTVILVKNLPPRTDVEKIREMFAQHGELGRVIMPPSGITALVEFLEPSEARVAFMKLAYTKFEHLPLYLEWAPDNSFKVAPKNSKLRSLMSHKVESSLPNSGNVDELKAKDEKSSQQGAESSSEDDETPEPDTTLFVKNLNFTTTEQMLKEHFRKCGRLDYVNIAMKKDPNSPGSKLSMGYGFIRYKLKADAERALKDLQTTVVDGKTLELKRSERALHSDATTARKTAEIGKQTGTKILVRNIPFQANVSEVQELFKAFGEIKALRLPKKMASSDSHRGFAFVDYYTKSNAKKAFNALCQSTHLYGRRLVLEWAQSEEGVDDIRKRTAKHFHQDGPVSRSKKSVLDPEAVGLAVE
ncbi:probable RNA-binding protein 19 [Athalia rosae]|uniref:probable RNA-binding protein 19 n=1 Tax=Athalia rosae TaxID=37344 RepID=UPI002033496E|nr:probable RNA-binding protein 19 [Athalia rosae]XP_048509394.1 probable RNA-binding protein 19 [Athalia rosae]